MRLTELHLRNIASIVSADIDFTSDLRDRITGDPASIFLISGDTGAGKSVILDGISMALYKKTPRLDNASNKKKNSFRSNDGEDVGINSIEQYTRMGTGPKDDCYSEVAFEGNDGVMYRARLTLGMYLTNKTATSDRHIEHKKPSWDVKVGDNDWVKDNSGEIILSAIGLTFEQFCRMAMLAQGKFESFLTGEKAQREAVLEQLTNTEHFSRFGETITQIYKDAEKTKNIQEGLYNNDINKPLEEEQVKQLTEDKRQKEAEKDGNEKALKLKESVKRDVQAIHDYDKVIADTLVKLQYLQNRMKSDAFLQAKAVVDEWDRTDSERHALTDMLKARKDLSECRNTENAQSKHLIELYKDINAREQILILTKKDLESAANITKESAKKALDKQNEIDSLTAGRNALNPSEVNTIISDLSTRKTTLGNLLSSVKTLSENKTDEKNLEKNLETKKSEKDSLSTIYIQKSAAHEDAKKHFEEASSRFSTMNASVDETIISLRHQLHVGDTCPLCGQHVDMILLEDGFKKVISPLEQEKNLSKAQMERAEKEKTKAAEDLATLSASIKADELALTDLRKKMESQHSSIAKAAGELELECNDNLAIQIESALKNMTIKEQELKGKQAQIESIQKQIDAAIDQKKALDKELTTHQAKEDELRNNVTNLSELLKDINTVRARIASEHSGWNVETDICQLLTDTNIRATWSNFENLVSQNSYAITLHLRKIEESEQILGRYYSENNRNEQDLNNLMADSEKVERFRNRIKELNEESARSEAIITQYKSEIESIFKSSVIKSRDEMPSIDTLEQEIKELKENSERLTGSIASYNAQLDANEEKKKAYETIRKDFGLAVKEFDKWNLLNKYFGGTRFRTLVQSHILKPLLNNANIYLEKITDRYLLTCSDENEQLAILVQDNYMKQLRSSTVLSGGEKFMVSLALSLALSSLNRPDMNVNILFIDEGFGTLDKDSLESVMMTLESLKEIAGQSQRRVGIISHREELQERIPVQIHVTKKGQGRSSVDVVYNDK